MTSTKTSASKQVYFSRYLRYCPRSPAPRRPPRRNRVSPSQPPRLLHAARSHAHPHCRNAGCGDGGGAGESASGWRIDGWVWRKERRVWRKLGIWRKFGRVGDHRIISVHTHTHTHTLTRRQQFTATRKAVQ